MIGLVLVTHGQLASQFVAAMEHVVGPQAQVASISIGPDDDMEQRRKAILKAVAAADSLAFLGSGMHFVLEAITQGAGFTIAQFTVDDVQSIPAPAALPLLLSGVMGLAFATRRRRGLTAAA